MPPSGSCSNSACRSTNGISAHVSTIRSTIGCPSMMRHDRSGSRSLKYYCHYPTHGCCPILSGARARFTDFVRAPRRCATVLRYRPGPNGRRSAFHRSAALRRCVALALFAKEFKRRVKPFVPVSGLIVEHSLQQSRERYAQRFRQQLPLSARLAELLG
jgi:hypothetical protein